MCTNLWGDIFAAWVIEWDGKTEETVRRGEREERERERESERERTTL